MKPARQVSDFAALEKEISHGHLRSLFSGKALIDELGVAIDPKVLAC